MELGDFEIIEKYEEAGATRYRLYHRPSKVIVNVRADSEEEALEKAKSILEGMSVVGGEGDRNPL